MSPPNASTFNNNLPPPPTITNPPPQIFTNYSPDGSQLPFGSSLFNAEQFNYDFGDFEYPEGDHTDPKRRRIARACDVCRKKKIKCDGKQPCSHCQNYKTDCAFTFTEKKRAQPKGAKYIEGLENRLGRMEHLLRLSGLLGEDEASQTDLSLLEQRLQERAGSVRTSASPISDHRRSMADSMARRSGSSGGSPRRREFEQSQSPREPAVDEVSKICGSKEDTARTDDTDGELAEMMDSLITNNQGETRYIGSSSGVSIFSPKGIKWVTEKTGDTSFAQMFASAAPEPWYHWRPEIFGDIFARHTYTNLPPKELCMEMLGHYFEYFNSSLPLFHEPTFMHLVDMQYSDSPYAGSGWWACLNVALAIAHRMRVLKTKAEPASTLEEANGWAYFKNALAVVPELILKNTDLLSVQALIGMCIFLQGTPNPQPSFALIGAALRSAQSIGLHKRGQGYGFNTVEVEQRKRVFWLAYCVDKDVCLRSGRPPAQEDSDWNVDLPSDNPEDGMGNIVLVDGVTTFNIFRKMCEFAMISSQVFQRLYSVKASKQTDGELLGAVNDLDAQLERWKESIPVEYRPEHDIQSQDAAVVVNIAILHFAYFNCVSTIHRRSIMQGIWSSRLAQYAVEGRNAQALNHRVFQSAALSVAAARLSISLLKYIPQGDVSLVWLIIYYPVSALVTVFGHILMNPQDPRARSDLDLVNLVVIFLQQMTAEDTTGSTRKMYEICRAFEGIARNAIEKAEREMNTRQKRKHERDQRKFGSIDLSTKSSGTTSTPVTQTNATSKSSQPQSQSQTQTTNSHTTSPSTADASSSSHPASASNTAYTGPIPPQVFTVPNPFLPPHQYQAQQRAQQQVQQAAQQQAQQAQQAQLQQLLQQQPLYPSPLGLNTAAFPQAMHPHSLLPHGGNNFAGLQNAWPEANYDFLSGLDFGGGEGLGGGSDLLGGQFGFAGMAGGGGIGGDGSGGTGNAGGVGGNGGGGGGGAGGGLGAFEEESFVPQDLWSMPMTFEWDWGDVNVGGM